MDLKLILVFITFYLMVSFNKFQFFTAKSAVEGVRCLVLHSSCFVRSEDHSFFLL